jgi:hypothetical protein
LKRNVSGNTGGARETERQRQEANLMQIHEQIRGEERRGRKNLLALDFFSLCLTVPDSFLCVRVRVSVYFLLLLLLLQNSFRFCAVVVCFKGGREREKKKMIRTGPYQSAP